MAYTANVNTIRELVSATPTTYDFLRPNAFRFTVKDMPTTSFTCQSANLPQLAIGAPYQPTPFTDIPRIGDKPSWGDFTIRFIIAEDMSNYLELYKWLIALGFPHNYREFKVFTESRASAFPFKAKPGSNDTEVLAYSDGTLTILDSTNSPKVNIIYKNLFPVSLEALDFDIASQTVEYFTAIATFKYTTFEIEPL